MKKLSNQIIEQFNSKDTFLIISDYPELSKHGEKNYGIAWYTKELLAPLAQKYNIRFVVLAEKTHLKGINASELYEDGKILVLRIFDQKHPSLFPKILTWLNVFNKIKNIHVHSEFCTNGGIKNFILLIPFLLLIKLMGRHIAYFSHNVVLELNSLAPHLGLSKKSLKTKIINFALPFYYKILGLIVNRFVVMDEVIKQRLALFVDPRKILLQPFWNTSPQTTISSQEARKKLGIKNNEFMLLYFGFITYYKGADWLIQTFKKLQNKKQFKNIRLIMAGGEAYSLKDKTYYKSYYQKLTKAVSKEKRIKIAGFVPEKDIPLYFKSSDAIIFPYRGIIGSSACVSHAISYSKPFVISKPMQRILQDQNIKKDIVFDFTAKSLGNKILQLKNPSFRKRLQDITLKLSKQRGKEACVASCYYNLYSQEPASYSLNPAILYGKG